MTSRIEKLKKVENSFWNILSYNIQELPQNFQPLKWKIANSTQSWSKIKIVNQNKSVEFDHLNLETNQQNAWKAYDLKKHRDHNISRISESKCS